MKNLTLLFSILFIFNLHVSAATITVCATGCDHTTVSAAIAAAATTGDVIDIQYTVHNEAAIVVNKNLIIQGQGQTVTFLQAAATQGAAVDGVFEVQNGLTVVFQDMTIQNGNAINGGTSNSTLGGGVRITSNASSNVSFNRVTIFGNRADSNGGGIYISGNGGAVSFTDCIIADNVANLTSTNASGGGIYNLGTASMNMNRCTVSGNSSGDDAGGIFVSRNGATNQYINCTIYNNTSGSASPISDGGAIYLGQASSHEFINCTVVNNNLVNATTRRGGGISWGSGNLVLINMIVANNGGASNATNGDDIYVSSGGAMTMTTSLVEDCDVCPVAPTYTTDPNLAVVAFCGAANLAYFSPQSPSDALGNGTAPGGSIPSVDICQNPRNAINSLGSIGDIPLPVEYVDFSVQTLASGNLLKWETALEQNNYGFHIQRSEEGANWEDVGFVEGKITHSGLSQYSFLDRDPKHGDNFYRLRQVDIDGGFDFSDVVHAFFTETAISVFPNPTDRTIEIGGLDEGEARIRIMDGYGRSIMDLTTTERSIDISALAAGMYFISVVNGANSAKIQFVKR